MGARLARIGGAPVDALTRCPLDETFSGFYSNFCRCCQIRLLANLPKEKRRREYERIRKREGGEESLALVIELVKAEYQRGVEHQAKTGKK